MSFKFSLLLISSFSFSLKDTIKIKIQNNKIVSCEIKAIDPKYEFKGYSNRTIINVLNNL